MTGLVKSLLGMGNPLLDIMAEVDQAILDKYDVSNKNFVHIASRWASSPPSNFLTADHYAFIEERKHFLKIGN